MIDLKRYDKFLGIKKSLDGRRVVYRQSPFNSQRQYNALEIENKYVGNWVLVSLMKMDTQRVNLIQKTAQNNLAIRHKKEDNRISKEIADFIEAGGESIIV